MYELINEDIPRRYDLGCRKDNQALVISLSGGILAQLESYCGPNNRYIPYYQQQFELADFARFAQGTFGYGGVFSLEGEVLTCPLPRRPSISVTEDDQKTLFATSTSLSILMSILSIAEPDPSETLNQLLHISDMNIDYGLHGGEFAVLVSRRMKNFLKTMFHDSNHLGIEETMRQAFSYMGPLFPQDELRAKFYHGGGVDLKVPGNATHLECDYQAVTRGENGYVWGTHNVDGIKQQLTLIMGVAALHQEARKAGF